MSRPDTRSGASSAGRPLAPSRQEHEVPDRLTAEATEINRLKGLLRDAIDLADDGWNRAAHLDPDRYNNAALELDRLTTGLLQDRDQARTAA